MAAPITWQNVHQGDVTTAWRGLDSAQKSINGVFDGLNQVVKGAEDTQAKNDVAIKNNNSQDYLNKLTSAFKSPEDLAAGLTDGRVDALKASYGNSINHEQVRGAADALLNTRYAQVKAATEYGHAMADERSHPFMQAYKVASLKGDKEGMAAADTAYTAAGGRDLSGLVAFADQRGQEVKLRGYADVNQADNLLTTANQRKNQTTQAEAARTSAGAAVRSAAAAEKNAKTASDSFLMQLQGNNNEVVLKAGAGLATLNSHLANSPEGKETINKFISSIKDDDVRAAAARIAQKLPADSKAGDVTTLLGTIEKSGFWSRTLGYGTNTKDDEVIKSFESVYNASKNDTQAAEGLKARKTLYNALAAQGIDGAQAAGNLLNTSLGVPNTPSPVLKLPAPAVANQEAVLREAAANSPQPMKGTPAEQAIAGIDAAMARTGQAMAKANASGNVKEIQRLQAIFLQQNAAKQAAMGNH